VDGWRFSRGQSCNTRNVTCSAKSWCLGLDTRRADLSLCLNGINALKDPAATIAAIRVLVQKLLGTKRHSLIEMVQCP
jgi:hypothetical protein